MPLRMAVRRLLHSACQPQARRAGRRASSAVQQVEDSELAQHTPERTAAQMAELPVPTAPIVQTRQQERLVEAQPETLPRLALAAEQEAPVWAEEAAG